MSKQDAATRLIDSLCSPQKSVVNDFGLCRIWSDQSCHRATVQSSVLIFGLFHSLTPFRRRSEKESLDEDQKWSKERRPNLLFYSKKIIFKFELNIIKKFNNENEQISTTNAMVQRAFQINYFVKNDSDNNLHNKFYNCRLLLREREEKQLFGIKKSLKSLRSTIQVYEELKRRKNCWKVWDNFFNLKIGRTRWLSVAGKTFARY